MTQYAVLIYNNDSAHRPGHTAEETVSSDQYADELERSGALVAAWALTPRQHATSVRGDLVTDGPFVEAKEIVVGFYVLEAPDLEAALAIARRNPACREGGGVEVRPIAAGGS
ncbi:YciI family protein [Microlunatus speluncae]|uniref:YciI family protein n=1 Tax=Microlunatus speluncae TaxID=2594267 RepID=UPI001266374F|nr:YciI family protein [Microlunatus speluncae]